jgi:hypothetical protein
MAASCIVETILQKPIAFAKSFRSKKQTGRLSPPRSKVKSSGRGRPLYTPLRSLAPPRQILFLLRREPVDLDPHRLQLPLGTALVLVMRSADLSG